MDLDAPPGTISLALGEPGWPMATAGLQAPEPRCGYGPNAGLPVLREALARHTGLPVDQAMVTAGSQAALFALLQAHTRPGDRVLVPDPGFPAYRTMTLLAGGEPVGYALGPRGALDPEAVADALTRAAREGTVGVLIVNHPGNPTGGGASREDLAAVAQVCAARGVLLVSDEVYAGLWLHAPTPGLFDVVDPGEGTAVVVSSVSKGWAAPGLRVGWALGSAELLAPARLVHNAMTTAAAVPSQRAAAALLDASAEVLPQARGELAARWAVVTAVLGDQCGPAPAGAFYLWLEAAGSGGTPAEQLAWCLRLRDEAGVAVVPGLAFGPAGAGRLRVSWGGPLDELGEGLHRLAGALR